jgi:hypothetical protein
MKIIIISGFLGSGKTTLLLSLAKFYAGNGYKTAIIENEVGEIPVDSMLLKSEGFSVRELFSGCICCSIRQDLSAAVRDIKETVNPDILLIEPTGIAAPEIVTDIIKECLDHEDSAETVLVVDYKRIGLESSPKKYLRKLPFLERSLHVCDHILLNIPEKVDENILHSIITLLYEATGGKKLYVVDVCDGKKVGEFVLEIEACERCELPNGGKLIDKDAINSQFLKGTISTKSSTLLPGEKLASFANHESTAVITFSGTLVAPQNSEMFKNLSCSAKSMMMLIGRDVKEASPDAEGHIKAYITIEKDEEIKVGNGLFLNMTCFGKELSVQGNIPTSGLPLKIVLNAIVYGMQQDILDHIIKQYANQFLLKQKSLIDAVS